MDALGTIVLPGVRAGSVRVAVAERPALGQWRPAWDALVAAAPLPSPFLRGWWLDEVAGAEAQHLLVVASGRLIGGIPLARDRWAGVPRYRFLGQGVLCPDHLDVVAASGRERQVVAALRAWFERPGQRVLDLVGLPADSLAHRAFGGTTTSVDVAPYEPLPATAEDYLAARSGKFRQDLRRAGRRLAEQGFEHRRVGPDGLPAAMAWFRRLHEGRDGRAPLLDRLPALTRAIAAGLERDEARVDVLENPDGVAAVSIAFTTGRRLSGYQVARSTAREHRNATNVLTGQVVADAIARGCRELDLLRGGEHYKSSFVTRRRDVHRLRVAHGALATLLLRARERAEDLRGPAVADPAEWHASTPKRAERPD